MSSRRGSRAQGTNLKALGLNPRALGLSPKQLGISPRQLGISPKQLAKKRQVMTDLSDELAAKRAAIRAARECTEPSLSAAEAIALLESDLVMVQAAIDALHAEERRAG